LISSQGHFEQFSGLNPLNQAFSIWVPGRVFQKNAILSHEIAQTPKSVGFIDPNLLLDTRQNGLTCEQWP